MYTEVAFDMIRPGFPPKDDAFQRWIAIDDQLPAGTVLIWADGRPMIGVLVHGILNGKPRRDFMDPRSDELLPWPTHWKAITRPDEAGEA